MNTGQTSANAVAKNAANTVIEAVNNAAKNIVKTANAAANGAAAPVQNLGSSVMRIGNAAGTAAVNAANTAVGALNSAVNAVAPGTNMSIQPLQSSWATPLAIFMAAVIGFLLLFSFFSDQIRTGYHNIVAAVRRMLGLPAAPLPDNIIDAGAPVIPIPPLPDNGTPPFDQPASPGEAIVEKILPSDASGKEVFNVSANDYTYYDAEPLCRALGAELATYDQVKQAWERGADWCNYGWIKGQVAVYPTQDSTYQKLQAGPEDQRDACGVTGVNGGYFDNPEMRFGVNCYGNKPSQSAHDAESLMDNGAIPRTTDALKTDEKAKDFAKQAGTTAIGPFNSGKWSLN